MQYIARLAAIASLVGSAVAEPDVTAAQKVVLMLQDMSAKAKKDKHAEEVSFSAFSTWCIDQQGSLEKAVAKETEDVELLSTSLGKLNSDSKVLGEEIAALQSDVAKYEADLSAAKSQREKDHADFLAEQTDYGESVDALERAIAVLSKQNYDRSALLQLTETQQLPRAAQSMVSAFLGIFPGMMDEPTMEYTPQADAYEFQSGGVIEMLKKLKSEFIEKKGDCEKEEMNSKHAYDMLAQDLTDTAAAANDAISSKSMLKNAKEQEAATTKKQLAATQTLKAEDTKTLQDVRVECKEKKESFKEKQTLREEEIQALEQAIKVLSSEDVQAAAATHLTLAATKSKVQAKSFVQAFRGSSEDPQGPRASVRKFLEQESVRLHSKTLNLLAQRISADPFGKVKKLIEDLISRLLEEGKADADHEGFCDKELGVSKITRTKLSETIDKLSAEIAEGQATITMLTQDVASLTKEIAELDAAVKEATEMRTAEKAQNDATIKDATGATKALEAAMSILKEFYRKASTATALFQIEQVPSTEWGESSGVEMGSEEWKAMANPNYKGKVDLGHTENMQTFGATYQGQQDEAGGVIAMLEVILSDFASLKADTESSEALSSKAHSEFLAESSKDKAVKQRKVDLSNNDKAAAAAKLQEDTADLKFTQDKLLAAERYYDTLKPQCIDNGMTFDERTKARADEIQSLKEALQILQGEAIA